MLLLLVVPLRLLFPFLDRETNSVVCVCLAGKTLIQSILDAPHGENEYSNIAESVTKTWASSALAICVMKKIECGSRNTHTHTRARTLRSLSQTNGNRMRFVCALLAYSETFARCQFVVRRAWRVACFVYAILHETTWTKTVNGVQQHLRSATTKNLFLLEKMRNYREHHERHVCCLVGCSLAVRTVGAVGRTFGFSVRRFNVRRLTTIEMIPRRSPRLAFEETRKFVTFLVWPFVHVVCNTCSYSSGTNSSSSSVWSLFVCIRTNICLPKRPFNLSLFLITSCVFETSLLSPSAPPYHQLTTHFVRN